MDLPVLGIEGILFLIFRLLLARGFGESLEIALRRG